MEDDAFDLYDDLEDFDYKVKYEESGEKVKELKCKLDDATKKISLLEEQKSELQSKIDNLERSFQSLLMTARSEIKRKDAQIADARKERDDLLFRRQKQPHFNKHPFRTNAKNPENSNTMTKAAHEINNENKKINKDIVKNPGNEDKCNVNSVLKNYDHQENQYHVIEKIEKIPPVESSSMKQSNEVNSSENQTPSNDKKKLDQKSEHPEKTVSDQKSRSRSHEKLPDHETNAQNKDAVKIKRGAVHESALGNHIEDKNKDKSDHNRNDFRRRSPNLNKMDDLRRRNSKDSNERSTEHHGYREPRDHREQVYNNRERRDVDRERRSKDQEREKKDRERAINDREKESNNIEKLNNVRDRRNSDREKGNKVREKENDRDKASNERDKAHHDHGQANKEHHDHGKENKDRDRRNSERERGNNDHDRRNIDRDRENDRDTRNSDRERGINDHERKNNDREKENDRDIRNNDRERRNNGREARNNVRENENNSRDRVNTDRDRRNTDRSRGIIDHDYGKNARDRRYNDRDRNHMRETDRYRDLPIKNSDRDLHKIDRERERNKDKNLSTRNQNRTHNQGREKEETKKIESRKNIEHKPSSNKLDPKPGRSLYENNKKDNSELDRRKNDQHSIHREKRGSLEEKRESKDLGRKRFRDEPKKEASKHKSSPSKKRKFSEKKEEKTTSHDTINTESIVPDAIDSFSEDHLEALKRQLEMQLNGEISNDAKFSSEEDEIPELPDSPIEPAPNSNLNTNDPADTAKDSSTKSSKEKADVKNLTSESDYTQVDMEVEPPRSVQLDVASENITFLPDANHKPKQEEKEEEIVPLCKKKRAMSALNAIERSDEKKSRNIEKTDDPVHVKSQQNLQMIDNMSDESKEINSYLIKEHSDTHIVNSESIFISTRGSENAEEDRLASKDVEQDKSINVVDNEKKPSPCKTDNSGDDRKQIIPERNGIVNNNHETTLNEDINPQNHQHNEDNTKIDAVQTNEDQDIFEHKGENFDTKIVDNNNSTNAEYTPTSDNQTKVLKSDDEKKETNNGSSCETSSDFSPRESSDDSTSESSSECTTHSSSSQSHSEEEQEKPAFLKSSTQMLKEGLASASISNMDASIDAKNASSGNRFQSSLDSLKNGEENEEEVLETPIKSSKHIKTYRILKNDDSQSNTVGKIVIVNSTPSKVVQENKDESKTAAKRKRENESSESSLKRAKNDVDSDNNNPNAEAFADMKFESLQTNQLDALEKQLAFEVYGEDIYEDKTKDLKKEQNIQPLNLSNDSIFGSNEFNSSPDKSKMLTAPNQINDIGTDRDELNHRILKEMGLEESEQNFDTSNNEPKEEKNHTTNEEFRHYNQDMISKQNSEVVKIEAERCLVPPEIKAENHCNSSNQSTESAEVEILGTIEILPSKSHDIQSQATIRYVKGPQRNTTKKTTDIPPSNQLYTASSNIEMKDSKGSNKSCKTAPNSKVSTKMKKGTTSKNSPARRGGRKVIETPKIIEDKKPFPPLILEKLKDSSRIISKTKEGIWLKCDCVSSECKPIAEVSNVPKCTPISESQPGALGTPLPGNVTSKEDVIVTVGKPLEESKPKQRRSKSNDNQPSTKSTAKSKSNVKMIGHIIEGFEREPSPPESKLDTSRELKHELFKAALGITSSTPYKSDSKVSDSSSNESVTETTDKKMADDLGPEKTKSKLNSNNHVDDVNSKVNNEKVSKPKSPASTDIECKTEIISDNLDPVSSPNKARDIESSDKVSSQIQILDVQIIQGCALNDAKDQLKCDAELTNESKEHPKSMSYKNVEESNDEPKMDKLSNQKPIVSRKQNRTSNGKETVSQIKTPLKHQENKTDTLQPTKETEKYCTPSKELSSSAQVPIKTPNLSDSSNCEGSSNNSDPIPHSKDCDIKKLTPDVHIAKTSPVADTVETLTSTQPAPVTAVDPCPSTPSVVKSFENPTCNENSPNNSILSRSQHEKRNISIASTDYVIEKVDNNVVNVFITRKKVKKKKKV